MKILVLVFNLNLGFFNLILILTRSAERMRALRERRKQDSENNSERLQKEKNQGCYQEETNETRRLIRLLSLPW